MSQPSDSEKNPWLLHQQHVDQPTNDGTATNGGSEEDLDEEETPIKNRIDQQLIDDALAESALPKRVRSITPFTVNIFECVLALKNAKELGESPRTSWRELRSVLNSVLELEDWREDDWAALDDFCAAWEMVKPDPALVKWPGESFPHDLSPYVGHPMRSPLTWIVVDCVQQLQRELRRAPFRSEIMKLVSHFYPAGIDDAELSKQLKKVGLSNFIPHQGGDPFPRKQSLVPAAITPQQIERIRVDSLLISNSGCRLVLLLGFPQWGNWLGGMKNSVGVEGAK
jgi:hypothetical protein